MHTPYEIGEIADKNIKATTDFFVVDENATSQQQEIARNSVLTVYDYDKSLSDTLRLKIDTAFALPRSVIESASPANNTSEEGKTLDIHSEILSLKPEFENKIGISVNKGAYKILENEKFSENISDLITNILTKILRTGVVANKDLLLKKMTKESH